jgi:diketogulonate reductase-like aldo/keto reductase
MPRVRKALEAGGLDRDHWRGHADHGTFGMRVPEGAGGLGMGTLDATLVAEEIGRTLASGPVVEAILAARLLGQLGAEDHLAGVVDGSIVATLAFHDVAVQPVQWLSGGAQADLVIARRGDEVIAVTLTDADRNAEETLAAIAELVSAGKVRAIGVCNESPWGVMRYLAGAPRIASVQNSYSLLNRAYELGLAEIGMRERVGLLAYSPLARGTLTGKYADPAKAQAQSEGFRARLLSPGRQRAIAAYAEIARDCGFSLPHMALAFAAAQPFVGSVLMAASNADQLADNLSAIDLTLPKEAVQAINAAHDAHPNPK